MYRDGPFGPGMCQLWVDADESVDLVELARSGDARLRQMSVFDAVVNNADRKIGHLLPDGHRPALRLRPRGVLLRRVQAAHGAVAMAGQEAHPAAWIAALRRSHELLTRGSLAAELGRWLTPAEVAATVRRIERLLTLKTHPYPPDDWPAVPWPPI